MSVVDAGLAVFDLRLLTRAQRYVWLLRADLRGDAAPTDPAGLCDFLCWWFERGIAEYPGFADPPTEAQYAALTTPAIAASPRAPPVSYFLAYVWHLRSDLVTAYPLDTEAGRRGYVEWLLSIGRFEVPVQNLWIDEGLRDWLLAPEPEAPPVPRLALDLWQTRPDLQQAYDPANPDGRQGLRAWLWAHGMAEHRLGWLTEEPPDHRQYVAPGAAAGAVPRVPPPVRADGVNLVGFATAEFGLGEDLRMAAKALDAVGIPYSVFEIAPGSGVHRRDRSVSRLISDAMPHRTSILCMAAFEAAELYLRCGEAAFADRLVIGYWPWELPRWPAPWASVFDLVAEIWSSSRYTQAAFAASSPVPVLHMPMAVELPRATLQPRARFALRDGVFQFLLVFDWHSWPARKNPAAAIEAFCLAFPAGDEAVGLAIKMIGPKPWSPEFVELKALADADSRVTLLPGTLDRSDLAALYRCSDAYVSLHRAEGFGRTLAEAMLMGKPVVATNWSGNVDFVDEGSGCPVNYTLRPVERGEYPYAEGQSWAEPDVASAAARMRWLAADWARAAALGRAGRERIATLYGVAAVGARYAERLCQLWQSPADRDAVGKPARPARRAKGKAAARA